MASVRIARRFWRAAGQPLAEEIREIVTHPIRWARRVDRQLGERIHDWTLRRSEGL